jgi:hypothetical protein
MFGDGGVDSRRRDFFGRIGRSDGSCMAREKGNHEPGTEEK